MTVVNECESIRNWTDLIQTSERKKWFGRIRVFVCALFLLWLRRGRGCPVHSSEKFSSLTIPEWSSHISSRHSNETQLIVLVTLSGPESATAAEFRSGLVHSLLSSRESTKRRYRVCIFTLALSPFSSIYSFHLFIYFEFFPLRFGHESCLSLFVWRSFFFRFYRLFVWCEPSILLACPSDLNVYPPCVAGLAFSAIQWRGKKKTLTMFMCDVTVGTEPGVVFIYILFMFLFLL